MPFSNNSSDSSINLDDILENSTPETSFLNTQIALLDQANAIMPIHELPERKKTVDEVWREIVEGKVEENNRNMILDCKTESIDEMMTLEDFLVKAGAVDEPGIGGEVKVESSGVFGMYLGGCGSGMSVELEGGSGGSGGMVRGRRRGSVLECSMDKASQQRQRRMIKNRESAARSRERKQAYQVELEAMAVRLEEENERLLKEKEERTKERFKQLMKNVIPIAEKRKPARVLRRVRSTGL